MSPHLHRVFVLPEDIGETGLVDNAVYLKWVQDAVVSYWQAIAPVEAVRRHLWVALHHEIEYGRPAFFGDEIEADVVSEGVAGCRAFFLTVIRRHEEILAKVHSTWCCISAATGRPVRPPIEAIRKVLGSP